MQPDGKPLLRLADGDGSKLASFRRRGVQPPLGFLEPFGFLVLVGRPGQAGVACCRIAVALVDQQPTLLPKSDSAELASFRSRSRGSGRVATVGGIGTTGIGIGIGAGISDCIGDWRTFIASR